MKLVARLLPLALLLLALPSASAAGTDHLSFLQGDTSVNVVWTANLTAQMVTDGQGNITFPVPAIATGLRVFLNDQAKTPNRTGQATPYDTWRLSVPASGGELRIEYAIAGTSASAMVGRFGTTIVLQAYPKAGYRPASGAATFADVGTSWHGGFEATGEKDVQMSFVEDSGRIASSDQNKWVWGIGGLVLGLAVMGFAIRQGWVGGSRAKKLVKGGELESQAFLAARRRTLMAALRDLEAAHEAKEVPDEVYFPLKEEYKQTAVRVMRTLEEKKEG